MSKLSKHEMSPLFDSPESIPEPTERSLAPDEKVRIDLTTPLASANEMNQKLGIPGNLVATVSAGNKDFMIVDTRATESNRDFFITDETFSMQSKKGFKGVEKYWPVVIGRSHYTDRFDYPATVSRDHFEVSYGDDGLFVRNLRPTNNTTLTAHLSVEPTRGHSTARHIVDDTRTHRVEDRMQKHPDFREKDDVAPYGYYLNHPIIGRASKSVDGGVYMGGFAREAIVVDGESVAMKRLYKSVETELSPSFARDETLSNRGVLLRVMKRVQESIPYDSFKTRDISIRHYGDQLIGLSTYVKERAGVCRHQALLAAYILENLVNDGYMSGTVGVERNTVEDLGGTHAWAVFKTKNNAVDEVVVIDPTQSFVGTKEQAQREGLWEYRLTSDKY